MDTLPADEFFQSYGPKLAPTDVRQRLQQLFSNVFTVQTRARSHGGGLLNAAMDLVSRDVELSTIIIETWILQRINKYMQLPADVSEINAILLFLVEHSCRNNEWDQVNYYSEALLKASHPDNPFYLSCHALEYLHAVRSAAAMEVSRALAVGESSMKMNIHYLIHGEAAKG